MVARWSPAVAGLLSTPRPPAQVSASDLCLGVHTSWTSLGPCYPNTNSWGCKDHADEFGSSNSSPLQTGWCGSLAWTTWPEVGNTQELGCGQAEMGQCRQRPWTPPLTWSSPAEEFLISKHLHSGATLFWVHSGGRLGA